MDVKTNHAGPATGPVPPEEKTAEKPLIRFADGELTALRPVFEEDLEAVVGLINASVCPIGEHPIWSYARLKKLFEDEKEPGLWTKAKRWYVVLHKQDRNVIGVIVEKQERTTEVELQFQFADGSEELARDGLATYFKYRTGFYTTTRINAEFASVESDKQRWLEELGFIHQARIPESLLWLGERCDLLLYSWIPQWVLNMRAPDGGCAD
jgi:hypothetical protein